MIQLLRLFPQGFQANPGLKFPNAFSVIVLQATALQSGSSYSDPCCLCKSVAEDLNPLTLATALQNHRTSQAPCQFKLETARIAAANPAPVQRRTRMATKEGLKEELN